MYTVFLGINLIKTPPQSKSSHVSAMNVFPVFFCHKALEILNPAMGRVKNT